MIGRIRDVVVKIKVMSPIINNEKVNIDLSFQKLLKQGFTIETNRSITIWKPKAIKAGGKGDIIMIITSNSMKLRYKK